MQKIIAGFDGSDQARDGLHLARSLAASTGAELIVAVAFGPVLAGAGVDLARIEDEYFADVFERAEAELQGAGFERRELRDVSAPRGLDRLADSEGADLIVIGSSHRGNFGRVLFGSVGERVLYGAPCAVAIAPRGYAGSARLGSGVIGIAYDGTGESRLALDGAIALATLLDGELRLITVASDYSFLELTPGTTSEEFMEAVLHRYRDIQEQALDEIDEPPAATGVLLEGVPAPTIVANAVD
jgi:nucleotide-binding universal stress UspA family protein